MIGLSSSSGEIGLNGVCVLPGTCVVEVVEQQVGVQVQEERESLEMVNV